MLKVVEILRPEQVWATLTFNGDIAQLVEHCTEDAGVVSSTLTVTTNQKQNKMESDKRKTS